MKSDVSYKKGEYEKAIEWREKSMEFIKADTSPFAYAYRYAHSRAEFAQIFTAIGQIEKAIKYYEKGLEIAEENGIHNIIRAYLPSLIELYSKTGRYKLAFEAEQRDRVINDSIVGMNYETRLKAIEMTFKVEQQEKELLEQRCHMEQEQKNAMLLQQRQWFLIGLASLLAFIGFMLVFYNRRQAAQKQKLMQAELRAKELQEQHLQEKMRGKVQDLTNLSLEITRKNEFSKTLFEQIEQLKTSSSSDIKKQLSDMERFVHHHFEINKELSILHSNMDKVNEDFYQRLGQRFPVLSQKDKNLCALISLNFSNKEIATIKNVTIKSAKMARYRLRKKLGLDAKEDIVIFLREI